jgi:Flp pilus assembly pilin Flp
MNRSNSWAAGLKGGYTVSAGRLPGSKAVRRWRVRGQGLVEYAMIITMMVIVMIAILTFLGQTVFNDMYSRIGSALPGPQ